jgi:long-chain fatty acid transport protein
MKNLLTTAAALALTAGAATAGGLDRTGQPIGIIFEEGNYAEFSFAATSPNIDGTDIATTLTTGEAAEDFVNIGFAVKTQINEQLSFALIYEQPFGSDISYPVLATSPLLSGTQAFAGSESWTGLLRYETSDRLSFHGGLRAQRASGNITLGGLAYGGVNGYNVSLDSDWALGYVLGVAYEIPDIALRVALTYNSAISHGFDTVESIAGLGPIGSSTTDVDTPQSVNLDFQTGIAEGTLLFGSVRWAEWSSFKIDPASFVGLTGGGLVDLEDSITYTIGVGRRFNENFAGSISYTYEKADDDDLVSPLAPTNGLNAISIGARYDMDNGTRLSGGVRFNQVGDARPETGTPDTARATFADNTAVTFGVRIGYSF